MALWRIVVKNSGNAACKDNYYCPLNMFLCRILVFWRKTSPLLRGNNGCPLKIPSLTRHKHNRGWLYLLF